MVVPPNRTLFYHTQIGALWRWVIWHCKCEPFHPRNQLTVRMTGLLCFIIGGALTFASATVIHFVARNEMSLEYLSKSSADFLSQLQSHLSWLEDQTSSNATDIWSLRSRSDVEGYPPCDPSPPPLEYAPCSICSISSSAWAVLASSFLSGARFPLAPAVMPVTF